MLDAYDEFLAAKALRAPVSGLTEIPELSQVCFPFQRDLIGWALRRGRAAVFADCGLGKTLMELEWSYRVPGQVLLLAPLTVSAQTVREGDKFGIECRYARSQADVSSKITVTNYEMLQHFDPNAFAGVVLDESSILKAYDGKTRNDIISTFARTPFKLACSATPSPNDYMELGNHSEFLGVMSRVEMLAMFFVHDGGETQKWRLKGHAETAFWRWVASWAAMVRRPSDLGYEDGNFKLPPLNMIEHIAAVDVVRPGELFPKEAETLQERIQARRDSVAQRVRDCADVVNASSRPWVVWCGLNSESTALARAIPGAVEVRGSDSNADKEQALLDFAAGKIRVLITKPSICGFGMNWQHCADVAIVGLSDSYEQFYQIIRRCWRFGQLLSVNVHIFISQLEGAVLKNIQRKEADAQRMADNMVEHMKELMQQEISGAGRDTTEYRRQVATGQDWTLHMADCVEIAREQPSDSIGFTVFSPPFASLYTYSNSDRDMGNSKDGEFAEHFAFLVPELYRITKPGRLVSFHCMNLPTSKVRDGFIGIRDFRGDLIRAFEAAGFIYHSEVCIWKDPVTAMQRTKALGLLHKQIKKDSCMSRQGIADYLVTMRKPGDNPDRVTHTSDDFPVELWQQYASPVWMDIDPSDTLQYRSARDHDDERHICPLQLEVIRRAMKLWSKPRDIVFSPFTGIGSEGYIALQMGRHFLGAELKQSYWEQARNNLQSARSDMGGLDLE